MLRWLAVLAASVLVLLAVPAPGAHGTVVLLSAAATVLLLAAILLPASELASAFRLIAPAGPARDERCLHGAFRRQDSPATPGKPGRPRAPGIAPLAA